MYGDAGVLSMIIASLMGFVVLVPLMFRHVRMWVWNKVRRVFGKESEDSEGNDSDES